VMKWKKGGLELMISDIKNELGISELDSTKHNEKNKLSFENANEEQSSDVLGLDKIDDYLEEKKSTEREQMGRVGKDESRIPVISMKKK
jgi:hypothetical protein